MEILTKNKDSIIEERSKLSLIKIKEKTYSEFENKIIPVIAKIGEETLKTLN